MNWFLLTPQHIALLRKASVVWDECECGAPAIDCKRPYGNSDYLCDVAKVVGLEPDGTWDNWNEENLGMMARLHRETETALQVVLSSGSFEPGMYFQRGFGIPWVPSNTNPEDV